MIKGEFQPAAIAALLLAASNANATIELRLNGQAYYDTETNLTWTTTMGQFGGTLEESIAFVSNFTVDGVGGWRLPIGSELPYNVHNISDCSSVMHCIQYEQSPIHFSIGEWFTFYWSTDAEGRTGSGWRPATNEGFPTWETYYASVWPVHTGDVAQISPVPEPETYAMLLAGLGLVGFMARRRKVSTV